jgi:hypothetical protein
MVGGLQLRERDYESSEADSVLQYLPEMISSVPFPSLKDASPTIQRGNIKQYCITLN